MPGDEWHLIERSRWVFAHQLAGPGFLANCNSLVHHTVSQGLESVPGIGWTGRVANVMS
jgi:hypothetical protein